MIWGHAGAAALLSGLTKLPSTAVWVGSAAPDLIDKAALYGLKWTKSGRMAAHNLLAFAVTTGAAGVIFGRKNAQAYAVGYFGHLLCDLGGFLPWFYPFKRYHFYNSLSLRQKLQDGELWPPAPVEWALLGAGALVLVRNQWSVRSHQ